jgi:predicted secreted protein
MAAINGNTVGIYVGGTLVNCARSGDVSLAMETIDVTCKDNGTFRQLLRGQQSAEFSAEGVHDSASTYGVEDLLAAFIAGTAVTIRWSTGVTAFEYVESSCFITAFDMSAPLNDAVAWTASFTSTGTITQTAEV